MLWMEMKIYVVQRLCIWLTIKFLNLQKQFFALKLSLSQIILRIAFDDIPLLWFYFSFFGGGSIPIFSNRKTECNFTCRNVNVRDKNMPPSNSAKLYIFICTPSVLWNLPLLEIEIYVHILHLWMERNVCFAGLFNTIRFFPVRVRDLFADDNPCDVMKNSD